VSTLSGSGDPGGAFHEGERAVQERTGETAQAAQNGRILGDSIGGSALPFLRKLQLVVLATSSAGGEVWASIVSGPPGFCSSEDGLSVLLELPEERRAAADPLWGNLQLGAPVGLLAIELATRRRLRINGQVSALAAGRVELAMKEAYPNCPKYIQRRQARANPGSPAVSATERGAALDGPRRAIIERSDTLFVASRHPRGHDASHRGGVAGFAQVVSGQLLRIPDYAGNSMFNTLGNLASDPAAGVTVLDFQGGRVLQLTGRARLLFDQRDPECATGGTGRFWEFAIERWIDAPAPALSWQFIDASPFNPRPDSIGDPPFRG